MAKPELNRSLIITLKRTNYGEADRILQLASNQGVVSAIAKGVRRQGSKLAGGVELFSLSDAVLARGKGSLLRLQSVRLVNPFSSVTKNYAQLAFAANVSREIIRAGRDVSSPEWFDLMQEVLLSLEGGAEVDLLEAWFNLRLANLLGEGLNLERDNFGNLLDADQTYRYDPTLMVFYPDPAGEIKAGHLKIFRLLMVIKPNQIQRIRQLEEFLPAVLNISRQVANLRLSQ